MLSKQLVFKSRDWSVPSTNSPFFQKSEQKNCPYQGKNINTLIDVQNKRENFDSLFGKHIEKKISQFSLEGFNLPLTLK